MLLLEQERVCTDAAVTTPRIRSKVRKHTGHKSLPVPHAVERLSGPRRRMVDPTTCERDYSPEEVAFMQAMDQYKRDNRRPFPTWSEVLEVVHALGYRKVSEPSIMPGLSATLAPKEVARCYPTNV